MYERDNEIYHLDSGQAAINYSCGNGVYERLGALMGFENALIAMIEEPEAVSELFDAITDYKIATAVKAKEYYNADAFTNYDDIATEKGLFMSPSTYRSLIKPQHARLHRAVKDLGMIPIQHTCGKADLLIEDFIETGASAWSAVQPTNDIVGILEKYGDRFCLEGGFNSNGRPGHPSASIQEVEAEVERCYREYGHLEGYIFFGFLLLNTDDPMGQLKALAPILEAVGKCRAKETGVALA